MYHVLINRPVGVVSAWLAATSGVIWMTCPKCGHEQSNSVECVRCGVIFAKLRPVEEDMPDAERLPDRFSPSPMQRLVGDTKLLLVDQNPRAWLEILLNWEMANEYAVQDGRGGIRGYVVEQGRGFGAAVKRTLLGSHRPLHLAVFSTSEREVVLELMRPFYFFMSKMDVLAEGRRIGKIIRRFVFLRARYELHDDRGQIFAIVVKPLLNIWTFEIHDRNGRRRGEIAKKWTGLAREWFTDADKFRVMFDDDEWTLNQKAVLVAAALSIDFDFFENNHNR